MEKQGKILVPILCMMMPLIPLTYLYARNAEYINAVQVAVVGGAMAILSLIGCVLIRLVFKSRLAAFLGCATAWILFFSLKSACEWIVDDRHWIGYPSFLIAFGLVTIVLTLLVSFAARGRQGGRLYPVFLIFLGVLLMYNAVPAIRTGIMSEYDIESLDLTKFKTQFNISHSAPSPNVYWFHCDGMLGFDAFQKYFGDDQAEFSQALIDRGFQIDRDAMVETNHTTKIAVPALMCPYFYDNTMRELLKDHETAVTKASQALSKGELQYARLKNETRVAFEQKGYLSQTIGSLNIYYPPVSDSVYVVGDSGGAYKLETEGNFEQRYLSIIEAGELAILLTDIPGNTYFNTVVKLGERGLLGFPLKRSALTQALSEDRLRTLAQGKKLQKNSRMILESLGDAASADQPTFNIVFYIGAHPPFTVDENGETHNSDTHGLNSYAPQHRYAATMLLGMIDEILSKDPDAVIVLQADHGLHSQSSEVISTAFGEDAVVPIWNQVLSALRVPEKYLSGQESYALANPLNMSRYLVNAFVGENYAYVQ